MASSSEKGFGEIGVRACTAPPLDEAAAAAATGVRACTAAPLDEVAAPVAAAATGVRACVVSAAPLDEAAAAAATGLWSGGTRTSIEQGRFVARRFGLAVPFRRFRCIRHCSSPPK